MITPLSATVKVGFLFLLVVAVLVTASVWPLLGPDTAAGASLTVNTTDDELNADGDCSLREAVQAANTDAAVDACTAGSGADTITVPSGTYTLSIAGAGEDANATGDLDISADLTINGAGAATTIIDANALDRTFHIFFPITAEISGLTIRNGSAGGGGGGIYNRGITTVNNSTVSGNTAGGGGGGIYNEITLTLNNSTVSGNTGGGGGGIHNKSTATLNNSTVSGNVGSPGGISNRTSGGTTTLILNKSTVSGNTGGGGGDAGGISQDPSGGTATITLINSTVSDNTNSSGGAGGIYQSKGSTLTLTDSTVSGNSASGGAFGAGGIGQIAVGSISSSVTLNNSTVSSNTYSGSGGVGGIFQNAYAGGSSSVTLNNSTVSSNTFSGTGSGTGSGSGAGGILQTSSASSGFPTLILNNSTVSSNTFSGTGSGTGGISQTSTSGSATAKNTIVANNSGGDCAIVITSAGHNLDSDGTCGLAGTGDINNANPLLGPLASNGGATQTHALFASSPATDAGSGDCPPPATDQRGFPRPIDGDGDTVASCDIGAFECPVSGCPAAPPTPTVTPTPTATLTPTVTPTPTKLPFKGDTDGDGCPDVSENGLDETLGGQRDYKNPYDWYDINQDGVIDLLNDILGVIQHYETSGNQLPPYDVVYDRGPSAGPNAWNMTAPDGVIDLLNDILGVILQYSPNPGCT